MRSKSFPWWLVPVAVTLLGCQQGQRIDPEPATETVASEFEAELQAETTTADQPAIVEPVPEPEFIPPAGLIPVNNAFCPAMPGYPVRQSLGMAYNGYWIGLCCEGCKGLLESDPERYAANLFDETGVDVRTPAPSFTPGG